MIDPYAMKAMHEAEQLLADAARMEEVKAFARERHGDQLYAGQPYEFHLVRVAQKLSTHGFAGFEWQASAWLHDIVEDTKTTIHEVRERFGAEIAALVWAVSGFGENRLQRNQTIYYKLRRSPKACALKVADRLVNHEVSICDPALDGLPSMKHVKMYLSERAEFEIVVRGFIPVSMWEELQRQYVRMETLVKK